MLLLIVALQVLIVLVVVVLLLRKPPAPATDPRLLQVPNDVSALRARLDATDNLLRSGFSDLLIQQNEAAERHRGNMDASAKLLRSEVEDRIEKLGATLHAGLHTFRSDNADGARKLSAEVNTALRDIDAKFATFNNDVQKEHAAAREALHGKLNEFSDKNQKSHEALREGVQSKLTGLGEEQRQHHEGLRTSVQERLDKLNQDNSAKLEEMRKTVDEKLEATLTDRITASFTHVGEGLKQVNQGIGEMKALSTEVGDLKRVFTNVKARGIVGEFQLGQQLEQMFSREQYDKNVQVRPNTGERVEYALKVPRGGSNGVLNDGSDTVFFPIDSKFPREDWERLEDAYEHGGAEEIAKAGTSFERAIKAEGKRICEKYINEPFTLPHAIMFLPTEGLYAEVMRRPGLQQDLQQQCNVTIAGPSTLMAILTSFRMGFHTIAMERKGHEIEKVLGAVKSEFGKFGDLIGKVETQVGTVQTTLGKIRSKTTTISRSLRGVTELPADDANDSLLAFEEFAGVAPRLSAGED